MEDESLDVTPDHVLVLRNAGLLVAALEVGVIAAALENGLILLSCGVHGNTIRILVPLTASDTLLDDGMDRLEHALTAARL